MVCLDSFYHEHPEAASFVEITTCATLEKISLLYEFYSFFEALGSVPLIKLSVLSSMTYCLDNCSSILNYEVELHSSDLLSLKIEIVSLSQFSSDINFRVSLKIVTKTSC
jgi:hypothetical protein